MPAYRISNSARREDRTCTLCGAPVRIERGDEFELQVLCPSCEEDSRQRAARQRADRHQAAIDDDRRRA